ncbi:uncharacterized protein LOC142339980 isoform X2 [Convolutriloba macropyga]
MYQALYTNRMGSGTVGGCRHSSVIWDAFKLVSISISLTCVVQYLSLVLTSGILCYSRGETDEERLPTCNVEKHRLLVEYEVLSSLITAILSWLFDCCNEIFVINKYGMFVVVMLKSVPSFFTMRLGVVLDLPCVWSGPPSLGGIPFQPMAILLPTVLRRWCVTSQTQDFSLSAQALKI